MGESDRKEALTAIREEGGPGEAPAAQPLGAGPHNRTDDGGLVVTQAAAGGDAEDRSRPPPSRRHKRLRCVAFSG